MKRDSRHIRAQKEGKKRDGYICQICGSTEHVEGHHVIDYAYGGAADKDNIVTLCSDHHKKVHSGKVTLIKI